MWAMLLPENDPHHNKIHNHVYTIPLDSPGAFRLIDDRNTTCVDLDRLSL